RPGAKPGAAVAAGHCPNAAVEGVVALPVRHLRAGLTVRGANAGDARRRERTVLPGDANPGGSRICGYAAAGPGAVAAGCARAGADTRRDRGCAAGDPGG